MGIIFHINKEGEFPFYIYFLIEADTNLALSNVLMYLLSKKLTEFCVVIC